MPYPENLNTSDPRSPEYEHTDRDEAIGRIEEAKADIGRAYLALCSAEIAWGDIDITDNDQEDAAALAPRIAALAADLPACLDRGANPNGLALAADLLDMALRLMKCRITTRSTLFCAGLRDRVWLMGNWIQSIEQEEARGQ